MLEEERTIPGLCESNEDEEYDQELCRFIDAVLRFCGECIKKGYMKPFEMKHKDPLEVTRKLRESSFHKDICNSYDKITEHSVNVNPFKH